MNTHTASRKSGKINHGRKQNAHNPQPLPRIHPQHRKHPRHDTHSHPRRTQYPLAPPSRPHRAGPGEEWPEQADDEEAEGPDFAVGVAVLCGIGLVTGCQWWTRRWRRRKREEGRKRGLTTILCNETPTPTIPPTHRITSPARIPPIPVFSPPPSLTKSTKDSQTSLNTHPQKYTGKAM